MKHTQVVPGYPGSNTALAEAVGDLLYDSLADFLEALSTKIESDATKDRDRGREKLAAELFASAQKIKESSIYIQHAWSICEPYVRRETE